jgi:translation initiation factor 1 (eIF-1/SUI1)
MMVAIKANLPEKEKFIATQVNFVELREVCDQLVKELDRNDFASGATVEQNEPMLRAIMGDQFEKFVAKIREFNFEDALLLLNEFIDKQDVSL